MDATNEFRFISGEKKGKKQKKREAKEITGGGTTSTSTDRPVPVCLTNSNKNVKLRFMWDKAFKLFHTNRLVYKAMSGISQQEEIGRSNTITHANLSQCHAGGLRCSGLSNRHSRSNNELHSSSQIFENEIINQMPGGTIGSGTHSTSYNNSKSTTIIKEVPAYSTPEDSVIVPARKKKRVVELPDKILKKKSHHDKKLLRPVTCTTTGNGNAKIISGGEKPQGDANMKMQQYQQNCCSNQNCNCLVTTVDYSEEMNFMNAGVGTSSSSSFSVRKQQKQPKPYHHSFIPSQAVQLKRSHSHHIHCTTKILSPHHENPKTLSHYNNHSHGHLESESGTQDQSTKNKSNFNSVSLYESPQPSPSPYHSSTRNSKRHSYSPDSSYSYHTNNSQDDSGLDTWKKCPGSTPTPTPTPCSSITCSISQRIPTTEKKGRNGKMQSENTLGSNKSCVLINNSNNNSTGTQNCTCDEGTNTITNSDSLSDYDEVECMSEIDLNSDDDNSTTVGPGLEELKMKFLMSTPSAGIGPPLLPTRSFLYPDNELDSLDLTLFETRRNESQAAAAAASFLCELGTIQDLESATELHSLPISDICDCGCSSRSSSSTNSETHFYDSVPCEGILGIEPKPTGIYSNLPGNELSVSSSCSPSSCWNWTDAGSEFEFLAPVVPRKGTKNRDITLGHHSRGHTPEVEWEPYFCVLNQLDQTFTSYRSEEMSIFPGTPTRPRTTSFLFAGTSGGTGDGGISPSEIARVRLDCGPNSVKCLINNSKWGMNPVLEEEEGEMSNTTTMSTGIEKEQGGSSGGTSGGGDYSSSGSGGTGSGLTMNQRNSSPASILLDTSYDKACSNDQRRQSAPLTPLLGRDTPSRFANFFSKRSFKSNPLKRTKSVTKLERKKVPGMEPESVIYPSRLRTSRSHESLLAWSKHSMNNFMNNGMMSTLDLTNGDIIIRPLHPSILGQDYVFQIITGANNSKYYSCTSLAERDAWVSALQQAIRPYADETRRIENSLKIWILEGKGLPVGKHSSSKKYFCELYLDDTLYGRTCGKPRGEMLFWGEHFEFNHVPNGTQLITIVFFREGDKKRKKERNTCIGKVKIPVNTVNSRYLIEKWYPVTPDANTNNQSSKDQNSQNNNTANSKDKDLPSLRVKCKYQSVDILPLRCYKPFLQYVKDEYGPVCECLENVLSVKAKEDLASAMVHVLHHEGLAKEFIAELALQEILKSGDEKLTFRGNSIATKAMEAFLKLTGSEYLHGILGSFIEEFQKSEDLYDCEIDPMKLSSSSSLTKNQQNLRNAVETVWKSILHSVGIFPIELRECFSHCRESLRSAGRDELSDHLISASIFLRFLCPAILSPSLFNITNEYPTEKSARNLTLVAKVLQTLANFTRFQGKEVYMEFLNDFLEREAGNMKGFLARISSPFETDGGTLQREAREKGPGLGIDLGKYSSVLATLLSESISKIAPKNERFKKLQDILENIHTWLKQPHNATDVNLFPFPHLTNPPTGPAPPPPPIHNQHRASTPIVLNPINPMAMGHHGHGHHPINIHHQYQIPGHGHLIHSSAPTPTPIYAVTNITNPNVKNITSVQLHHTNGIPLQLQIPPQHSVLLNSSGLPNLRSGSQASSGYQSQSPVLEGDKSSKTNSPVSAMDGSGSGSSSLEQQSSMSMNPNSALPPWTKGKDSSSATSSVGSNSKRVETPLSFSNPGFPNTTSRSNKSHGSQSVDDLSSFGIEALKADDANALPNSRKRLSRSSSSSECEYAPSTIGSSQRLQKSRKQVPKALTKLNGTPHGHAQNRHLNRRSSAELLRKNHPYSSSTEDDDDSDSGHVNDKELDDHEPGGLGQAPPQLPPRRHGNKLRSSGCGYQLQQRHSTNMEQCNLQPNEKSLDEVRNANEGSYCGINPLEYEREMVELRRAMEKLQIKLNRAEERLFGHESSLPPNGRAGSPGHSQFIRHCSPSPSSTGCAETPSRNSRNVEEKEMEQLLQRFMSAEEEMKREQELLTALDKKQKLIEAQEQKISRLDSVNNQLLTALSQIRDSLQQQHVQQQQYKIQQQLLKQQQHLQSLTNQNFLVNSNNNTSNGNYNGPVTAVFPSPRHSKSSNRNLNNTTKILITSDHSHSSAVSSCSSPDSLENNNHHHHQLLEPPESNPSNRDSSAILGEQALQMLADLKSSSC